MEILPCALNNQLGDGLKKCEGEKGTEQKKSLCCCVMIQLGMYSEGKALQHAFSNSKLTHVSCPETLPNSRLMMGRQVEATHVQKMLQIPVCLKQQQKPLHG